MTGAAAVGLDTVAISGMRVAATAAELGAAGGQLADEVPAGLGAGSLRRCRRRSPSRGRTGALSSRKVNRTRFGGRVGSAYTWA